MNKLDDIRLTVTNLQPHIISISETWLHNNINDDLIKIPNYSVFRNDRADKKGGGVAVWIHNSIRCKSVALSNIPCDINCVVVLIPVSKLIFISLYVQPQTAVNDTKCNLILSFLSSIIDSNRLTNPDFNVIICGDLNRFDVNLICSHFDLVNKVDKPTRINSMLDYFFVPSAISHLFNVSVNCPIANSDHRSVFCDPIDVVKCKLSVKKLLYDLRDSHIANFVAAVSSIDWTLLYSTDFDVNAKCQILHDTITDCMLNTIPHKVIYMSESDPPWFTPLLKHLINERWAAYKARDFNRYNLLRARIKNLIVSSKLSWANSISASSKNLWNAVKSETGASLGGIPSFLQHFTDCDTAVNAINDSLCKVFDKGDANYNYQYNGDLPQLFFIDSSAVYFSIMSYPIGKSYGSDLIPIKLYKSVAHCICDILCNIFNDCIRLCKFPDLWKIAHVTCIPKISNASINDIRPISLLPLFSKLFERFIFNHYAKLFVDCYGKHQFGFRVKSSTTCALIHLHNFITMSLENPNVKGVQTMCYDLTRAFEKVTHSLIIKRLFDCNFPPNLILLIQSFLTNRIQHVRIGSAISKPAFVTSGVPQGSVLAPALFSLVAATFNCLSDSNCVVKFADDFTIACPLLNSSDNNHVIDEHQHFLHWTKCNSLVVNPAKSKCIIFGNSAEAFACNIPNISIVSEIKLLGVFFATNLSWDTHINYVIRLASRRLYALYVLRNVLEKKHLIRVYEALVRSILEYCSPLFIGLNGKNSDLLEKVQRRAHKIICNSNCNCNFQSISDRRLHCATTWTEYMVPEYMVPEYMVPEYMVP